jgi:GDP-4-dehydro-6-deoxy-D-mannose reductase
MRILITGVAGFVGRHMADLAAEQGATAYGLGRRPRIAADPPRQLEEYLSADLLDQGQIEQAVQSAAPDRVFHLAAEASVARSWEDPQSILTANLVSSFNLLESVRRHAPQARVLIACSGEEYGRPETLPIEERQLLRPQNPYAVSKAAADLAAGFYADAYGLHVVRTRAFNHCGPGQSAAYVVSSFASQIAEAELATEEDPREITTGDTSVLRDFTDVRDVTRAYWLALEHCEPGAYNVCSGRAIAIDEILDGLLALSKVEVRVRTDARLLRPNEVEEVCGSNALLHDASGWSPQVPLADTLSDTLEWWREKAKKEHQIRGPDR